MKMVLIQELKAKGNLIITKEKSALIRGKEKGVQILSSEKRTLIIATAAAVLLLLSMICVGIYRATHLSMFGQKTDIFVQELDFNGREIPDYDQLCSYLSRFPRLQRVDLGSFPVEAEKVASFQQSFPNTELVYDTVVRIEGENVPVDTEVLDLSKHGFSDLKEFLEKLSYLPKLRRVTFGELHIPQSQKDILMENYPEVDFEVLGTYEIYGKVVLENAEKLDLRDVQLDASLFDQLALLPQLRKVDLHDQPLSESERLALTAQFPDVSFGWSVTYDGETYDSNITELDISGKPVEDLDALRKAVAMLPDLEKLVMCDCGMSNEEMADLQKEMKDIKVVWRIRLGSRWSLRTDAVAFSVFIIHYDYPRMSSADIEVLKYCTDLKALDLGHQRLTDLTVIGEYLTDLRLLIVADNAIRDLTPLSNLKHLHYLEFFLNQVRDVTPLKACKELVDLNISYNPISDIEPLLYAPMMERVWLESTYVGNNGVALLQDAYPDAKIVRYGSGSVDQGWRWDSKRYLQMMDMWQHDYYGDEFSKYDDLAEEMGLR